MKNELNKFSQEYAQALRSYLRKEREAVLHQAYKLGCRAGAHGLGVLDMAGIHQRALEKVVVPALAPKNQEHRLRASETFFLESLSPFEVTHRGFREANLKLRQLIATLEQRNLELADINRKLGREINDHKRTEKALRESETHYRELFHRAETMKENLRNLSNQILHVQEEERKRISRELHDEVGQAMTAIHMNLAVVKKDGAAGSEFHQQRITDAQRLIEQTMETVHRFARELRPAMLDELGLLPALRSYVKNFAARTGLQVRFRATPAAESLDGEQKTVMFRVAQESLTNVAKHAQAHRVEITVHKLTRGIRMQIKDDGRSFPVDPQDSPTRSKRLGLLGMQERVRLVNGKFLVEPKPGKGTTVRVEIPFKVKIIAPMPAARGGGGRRSQPPIPLRRLNLRTRTLIK